LTPSPTENAKLICAEAAGVENAQVPQSSRSQSNGAGAISARQRLMVGKAAFIAAIPTPAMPGG
jgi:hypothetical protein